MNNKCSFFYIFAGRLRRRADINYQVKRLIIIADGMADRHIGKLGGHTPLQHACTPCMDLLARKGRCGMLITVPDGLTPGSDVAITSILGYDAAAVGEGRGPIEAAGMGYEIAEGDLALRCNLITIRNGIITSHNGDGITTAESQPLIRLLSDQLDNERVHFMAGSSHSHLLVVKQGERQVVCTPPHDLIGQPWREFAPVPDLFDGGMTTAMLLRTLIVCSQQVLAHRSTANSIWPWSGGHRLLLPPLRSRWPQLQSGAVVTATSLVRGIARYAGLHCIDVPGATGRPDTNYEAKAQAAIDALRHNDLVLLHVEAPDEASHCGDLPLKLQTIEDIDARLLHPICEALSRLSEPMVVALLPDHPTPVELRTHTAAPVPFLIYYNGIVPDAVDRFDESACAAGAYGLLQPQEFMPLLMGVTTSATPTTY